MVALGVSTATCRKGMKVSHAFSEFNGTGFEPPIFTSFIFLCAQSPSGFRKISKMNKATVLKNAKLFPIKVPVLLHQWYKPSLIYIHPSIHNSAWF